MAVKPNTTPASTKPQGFHPTVIAIVGSLVISIVLATVVTGNPFRALRLAYTDYSGTPAAGAPKASTTTAPAAAH